MTTEQRLEAVKQILVDVQEKRFKYTKPNATNIDPETDVEKALMQLLLIVRNQEAEIDTLKGQVEDMKVDIKWLTNNTSAL